VERLKQKCRVVELPDIETIERAERTQSLGSAAWARDNGTWTVEELRKEATEARKAMRLLEITASTEGALH
jgi:hypothetical protein